MKKFGSPLLIALFVLASSGCSTAPAGDDAVDRGAEGAKIDQMDVVTVGGSRQAVLSLHKRYAYPSACKFGLTLTNNLPYGITNISFRFTAYAKENAPYQQITRNFFEIDPANRQYREITFSGITCDEISYIEVGGRGRCAMGDLTRFSSRPGDCIRHVHIAKTPYVRLVQK